MSSIIAKKRKNKAYRRQQALFFNQMMLWVAAKQKGEELKMPAEFAGDPKFREQFLGMNKFFQEQYDKHGTNYMLQLLAEAKERGWLLEPDEFIKEFGGGDK